MAVKIRLNRLGAKKNPYYRIVVADSRAPRDGRFIEILGNYDPSQTPALVNVDEEKVLSWMSKGAQPTDTVKSLLSKQGIMTKFAESKKQGARDAPEAPCRRGRYGQGHRQAGPHRESHADGCEGRRHTRKQKGIG